MLFEKGKSCRSMFARMLQVVVVFVLVVGMAACARQQRQVAPAQDPRDLLPPTYGHTVLYQGETLALISLWYTGRTTNWKAIQEANPGLRPERIRLGQLIQIPRALMVKDVPMPKTFVRSVTTPKEEPKPDEQVPVVDQAASPEANVPATGATPEATPEVAPEATPPAATEATSSSAQPEPTPPAASKDSERDRLLDELLAE